MYISITRFRIDSTSGAPVYYLSIIFAHLSLLSTSGALSSRCWQKFMCNASHRNWYRQTSQTNIGFNIINAVSFQNISVLLVATSWAPMHDQFPHFRVNKLRHWMLVGCCIETDDSPLSFNSTQLIQQQQQQLRFDC